MQDYAAIVYTHTQNTHTQNTCRRCWVSICSPYKLRHFGKCSLYVWPESADQIPIDFVLNI